MAENVTVILLKVDLQCPCCYKKVKKVLCKFPKIRDQVYDEKNNTVKIIVVCACPKKIRSKLRCKGRKTIKCIEIIPSTPPPKPPPTLPSPSPRPPLVLICCVSCNVCFPRGPCCHRCGVCQCGSCGHGGCRGNYPAYFREENSAACTIM